jgi:two-component system LytT family sensor kinase
VNCRFHAVICRKLRLFGSGLNPLKEHEVRGIQKRGLRWDSVLMLPLNQQPFLVETRAKSSVAYWLRVIFVWALFGFWSGNQTYIDMHLRGMHHSYPRMIFWGFLLGMQWVPLTPLMFGAARKFPLESPRFFRSLPIHLALFIAITLAISSVRILITWAVRPFDPLPLDGSFSYLFVQGLQGVVPTVLLLYIAVVGVGHAIEYRRSAREKEVRSAQLEALLSQAQVLSLKMQLHPHFLFNTLNGIVALVRDGENAGAVKMLLGLSNMLRYALDSSGRQEVPLAEELEFLNLYLGVEQMRFPDRLKVKLDVAPETLNANVPSLILQPLVENAIRHGVAQKLLAGSVNVSATRRGNDLVMTIDDDGPGLRAGFDANGGEGIGLNNTRARLKQLYGEAWKLTLVNRPEGGARVTVALPFATAAEPARIA